MEQEGLDEWGLQAGQEEQELPEEVGGQGPLEEQGLQEVQEPLEGVNSLKDPIPFGILSFLLSFPFLFLF